MGSSRPRRWSLVAIALTVAIAPSSAFVGVASAASSSSQAASATDVSLSSVGAVSAHSVAYLAPPPPEGSGSGMITPPPDKANPHPAPPYSDTPPKSASKPSKCGAPNYHFYPDATHRSGPYQLVVTSSVKPCHVLHFGIGVNLYDSPDPKKPLPQHNIWNSGDKTFTGGKLVIVYPRRCGSQTDYYGNTKGITYPKRITRFGKRNGESPEIWTVARGTQAASVIFPKTECHLTGAAVNEACKNLCNNVADVTAAVKNSTPWLASVRYTDNYTAKGKKVSVVRLVSKVAPGKSSTTNPFKVADGHDVCWLVQYAGGGQPPVSDCKRVVCATLAKVHYIRTVTGVCICTGSVSETQVFQIYIEPNLTTHVQRARMWVNGRLVADFQVQPDKPGTTTNHYFEDKKHNSLITVPRGARVRLQALALNSGHDWRFGPAVNIAA